MNAHAYDFASARDNWGTHPPFATHDIDAAGLLNLPAHAFKMALEKTRHDRYFSMNERNAWTTLLLPSKGEQHKRVLDFGCGSGVDSCWYKEAGHSVWLADTHPAALALAYRVFAMSGLAPDGFVQVTGDWPYFLPPSKLDVFLAVGVLHHIPYAGSVVKRAAECLVAGGEMRLLVYSDFAWSMYTEDKALDIRADPRSHPRYQDYLRGMDPVHTYADWYNEDKLRLHFGEFFELKETDRVFSNQYLVARMARK